MIKRSDPLSEDERSLLERTFPTIQKKLEKAIKNIPGMRRNYEETISAASGYVVESLLSWDHNEYDLTDEKFIDFAVQKCIFLEKDNFRKLNTEYRLCKSKPYLFKGITNVHNPNILIKDKNVDRIDWNDLKESLIKEASTYEDAVYLRLIEKYLIPLCEEENIIKLSDIAQAIKCSNSLVYLKLRDGTIAKIILERIS